MLRFTSLRRLTNTCVRNQASLYRAAQRLYSTDANATANQQSQEEENIILVKPIRKTNKMKYLKMLAGLAVLSGIGSAFYSLFNAASEKNLSVFQFLTNRFKSSKEYFDLPPSDKLLPDLPESVPAYMVKPTLVIALEGLLVVEEWSRDYGWRLKMRPHMMDFLAAMEQHFEVVLFSKDSALNSGLFLEKLDPDSKYNKLFREATYHKNGKHYKDLSRLNRSLGKVINVDVKEQESYCLQPENAIPVPEWSGKPDDFLLTLRDFLLHVQQVNGLRDIRLTLNHYRGIESPLPDSSSGVATPLTPEQVNPKPASEIPDVNVMLERFEAEMKAAQQSAATKNKGGLLSMFKLK